MMLFLVYLVLIPVGSVWYGFVLVKLWTWFIIPTFGAPALTIPAAIGLSIVITYLTWYNYKTDNDKSLDDKLIEGIVITVGKPLMALAVGWIVLQFM